MGGIVNERGSGVWWVFEDVEMRERVERSIRVLEEEKLREYFFFLNGIIFRIERNKLVRWLKIGIKGFCDKVRI